MKIICIGRNYIDHAKELNNPLPLEPIFFMKSENALLPRRHPFYIPDFTKDLHYECELVLKISRLGKHISEKYAHKYFDEIGLGIDFTARDLQQKCKEKGLPWEIAKAWDYSSPLGKFIPVSSLQSVENIEFRLEKNNKIVQSGNSKDMIFSFSAIIAYVSKYITLKQGDLIFTGTPAGVGPVQSGDLLEGFIGDSKFLSLKIS